MCLCLAVYLLHFRSKLLLFVAHTTHAIRILNGAHSRTCTPVYRHPAHGPPHLFFGEGRGDFLFFLMFLRTSLFSCPLFIHLVVTGYSTSSWQDPLQISRNTLSSHPRSTIVAPGPSKISQCVSLSISLIIPILPTGYLSSMCLINLFHLICFSTPISWWLGPSHFRTALPSTTLFAQEHK